ncbi:MAG TPA: cytochrome P450 [Candidatus Acidoferrales bacterium]|nr:cytochrome P450 [Candidatus Acidoferrales bacterium]
MAQSQPQVLTLNVERRAPGKRFPTAFHFFFEARRDPLAMLLWAAREYGDVARFDAWPLTAHLVFHPDHVKYVLQDNNRNYWKGDLIGRVKPLIGEGLFTSEGDFWRRQRRLAQPAFHRERIESFATIMSTAGARLLDGWESIAAQAQPFDLMEQMSRVTLSIVGQALFGIDLTGEAADVGRAMLVALQFVSEEAFRFFPAWLALPTPRNLRFKRARAALDRVVLGIIDRRRQAAAADDLLAMLMEARDAETGEGMSDRQLRDEIMTFVLAGHETTAVTLAWAWHLLAQHPEVADRLRHEVSTVLAGKAPTLTDLPRLQLTRRVIDETLRLYPPVPVISRETLAADEIAGYAIPAKTGVMLSPYVTHRHPALWPDPERFDPERFTPERCAARPRFAYFPFSGGPRLCIGNEFALMEATILLAMTAQRYRIESVPGHTVQQELRVTLRPRQPMLMRLRRV